MLPGRVMPRSLPRVEGLDYYGECRPASGACGDFFDFAVLPQSSLAVTVGDVAAEGDGADVLKSGLQAFLRSRAVHGGEVARVVEELNRAVCEVSFSNFYATLFYAHVDPVGGQLHYASARHEPALLVRDRTGRAERLQGTGTVLGVTPHATYQHRTVSIDPRDVLVAFTDGLPKSADSAGQELGEQGILRMVRNRPHARAAEVVCQILDETGRNRLPRAADDRTAIVIRFSELASAAVEAEAAVEPESKLVAAAA